MLMASLARTPGQCGSPCYRTPVLKSSTLSDLQVAELQEHATTPSRLSLTNKLYLR